MRINEFCEFGKSEKFSDREAKSVLVILNLQRERKRMIGSISLFITILCLGDYSIEANLRLKTFSSVDRISVYDELKRWSDVPISRQR